MTTLDPIDLPTISEQKANEILDDAVHCVITLRDEQGSDIVMDAQQKLVKTFGDFAPVVAQMVLLGSLRAFELGVVEATPGSDRTDILVSALRRVHVPEMYGDCVEDGEHYPCKSARVLDLVAGRADEPQEPDAA